MQLTGFSLEGDAIFEPGQFDFFSTTSKKGNAAVAQVCLAYAANGTGKTSLGRRLIKQTEEQLCTFHTKDRGDLKVLANEKGERINISLFNEDFIQNKIRIVDETRSQSGNLQAIAYVAHQVDNKEKIDELNTEIDNLKNKKENLSLRRFKIDKNGEDRKKEEKTLRQLLKKTDSFCDLVAKIPPYKNRNITDKIIRDLKLASQNQHASQSANQLIEKFRENCKKLDQVKESDPIDFLPKPAPPFRNIEEFAKLLERSPQSSAGGIKTDHFQSLLMSNDKIDNQCFDIAKDILLSENVEHCPVCTQQISENLRNEIREAISSIVYGDEAEELKEQLQLIQIPEIFFDDQQLLLLRDKIASSEIESYQNAYKKLGNFLGILKAKQSEKLQNVNRSISIDLDLYNELCADLDQAARSLSEEIDIFNKTLQLKDELQTDTEKLAFSITALDAEVYSHLDKLVGFDEELDNINGELESISSTIPSLEEEINRLSADQSQTSLAVKFVNQCLRIVFADSNRIEIRPADNEYAIFVRGNPVRSDQLSTGERNILALAFFFALIFEGSDDYDDFKYPRFLVLDDPISSFDSDNRYGVLLLIKDIVSKFCNNEETRIIILSHDMLTIRDLYSTFKVTPKLVQHAVKLKGNSVGEINLSKFEKYRNLLIKAFRLARSEEEQLDEEEILGGNELRIILEGFSTFEIGCGISDLLNNPVVHKALKSKGNETLQYFSTPLYKLVLHGESHMSDSVKSGYTEVPTVVCFAERRDLCRDLICLMDAISPSHIPARLGLKNKATDEFPSLEEYGDIVKQWNEVLSQRTISSVGTT